MRIEGPGRSSAPASGGSQRVGSGARFTLPDQTEKAPTQNSGAVRAATSLNALLALQEVDQATERRRRAVSKGRNLLGVLDKLKVGLLEGQLSEASIAELKAALQEEGSATEDPGLNSVLAEIELRAEVEVAKLEQSSRNV